MSLTVSKRAQAITSFMALSVRVRADELSKLPPEERPFPYDRLIQLQLGQPATSPHPDIISSLSSSKCPIGYTHALGIPALREAISAHYQRWYNLKLPSSEIAVTGGASGAFLTAFATCFDQNDRVAMAVPGYSCYENVLIGLGVESVNIPVDRSTNYQVTPELLEPHLPLNGLVIASPSNPCSFVLDEQEMDRLVRFCDKNNIRLVVDEIYHGLGVIPCTAAKYQQVVVINSFSKYWCLSGFRIGWVVIRDKVLMRAFERVVQNFSLCTSSPSQYAALLSLTLPNISEELESHVLRYKRNQGIIVAALKELGFEVDYPEGAFYVWANCERVCERLGFTGSFELSEVLLERFGVAVSPGLNFDKERGEKWMRLCTSGYTNDVEEAMARIRDMCAIASKEYVR